MTESLVLVGAANGRDRSGEGGARGEGREEDDEGAGSFPHPRHEGDRGADRRIGALASDAALLQGSPRSDKERDIETARAWRQRLQGDLEALDPAVPGLDWPALKTRVERNLDVDQPSSMPRLSPPL